MYYSKKKIKNNNGFTLVEVMVVVAIIGILSTVAVPQFKQYQSKSKMSEAKLSLAAIHTAQNVFRLEANTYATCLETMGYVPASYSNTLWNSGTEAQDKRYYTAGFNSNSDTSPNTSMTGVCDQSHRYYLGTKSGNQTIDSDLTLSISPMNASPNIYKAQALGTVSTDNVAVDSISGDSWTIDQDKLLIHNRIGL